MSVAARMHMPGATVNTHSVPAAGTDVISYFYPVPGLGVVPINAFLLRSQEPVLVDTGHIAARELFFDAVSRLIDLDDLRWIYLTHADPDHVGCLPDLLRAARNARLVTTFLGLGRLGLYQPISPDRVYLLNPGQRLSVGDRELEAVAPVTFDAPETTPFIDCKTRALFSSDCFGGVLPGPAEAADEFSASSLLDGVSLWATIDTPWLRHVDAAVFEAKLEKLRTLAPRIVLSSHLPPAAGMFDALLGYVAAARTRPAYVGPDQAALAAMLGVLAAEGDGVKARPRPTS
jgi:flavorubredoxin